MGSSIQKIILKTLIYSDIFDYPLTKEEIWEYLIVNKTTSKKEFEETLLFSKDIYKKDGFYFLKKRKEIVGKRLHRIKPSFVKIQLAFKVARILGCIPTIRLIGLSGALAMENSEADDDIDFFIITSKNTMWTTRLFSLIVLDVLGYRRRRNEINPSDKICLNMFISEDSLTLPRGFQNVYSAHEIIQMRPLINKRGIYERFISANRWVKHYMYNSVDGKIVPTIRVGEKQVVENIFEKVSRKIQLISIKKHQTTEVVSDSLLAFHPKDYRNFVLKEYNKRLKEYIVL